MKERRDDFLLIKDDTMKAVYSTELSEFLTKMGVKSQFEAGDIKCRYCKATITAKNLYAFVPINGVIEFCCNNPSCTLRLTEEAK